MKKNKTGFKDRNGKEICEGDAVKITDFGNVTKGEVKQHDGQWIVGYGYLSDIANDCDIIDENNI